VISFSNNVSSSADIRRLILSEIGATNVRRATSAVVTGFRSEGGDTKLGLKRARAVRSELLKLNPNLKLRITVVDASTQASGRDECVRNQCAIVRLSPNGNINLRQQARLLRLAALR
jgi:hypothetical protein